MSASTELCRWYKNSRPVSELAIVSTPGVGTKVSILLAKASPTSWFLPKLTLTHSMRVVIVDSNSAVRQIWEKRLLEAGAEVNKIEIVHLSSPDLLRDWVLEKEGEENSTVYLVDQQFLGTGETGLELIASLNLEKRAVLVTSRFGQRAIQSRCELASIPLLPKSAVTYLPIEIRRTKC